MNSRVNVVSLKDWNDNKEQRSNKEDLIKYFSLLSFSELINEVSELSNELSTADKEEASLKSNLILDEFNKRSHENPELKNQILMIKSLLKKNIELL